MMEVDHDQDFEPEGDGDNERDDGELEEQKEGPNVEAQINIEPINAKMTSQILSFLEDLRSDPQAAAFNMPVNWRALNIPDYPQIVKNPMDLQTLEMKVRGQYILPSGKKCPPYAVV